MSPFSLVSAKANAEKECAKVDKRVSNSSKCKGRLRIFKWNVEKTGQRIGAVYKSGVVHLVESVFVIIFTR